MSFQEWKAPWNGERNRELSGASEAVSSPPRHTMGCARSLDATQRTSPWHVERGLFEQSLLPNSSSAFQQAGYFSKRKAKLGFHLSGLSLASLLASGNHSPL